MMSAAVSDDKIMRIQAGACDASFEQQKGLCESRGV